ncbi:hypothetical protein [Bacillus cereus]|nr:hypothetical protein [Bacillus cereus]
MGDAYVGMIDEVPARVLVHRLTKQQQLTGILCVGKSACPDKDTLSSW